MIATGTAATRGTAPLRLYDLLSGAHLMDLGSDLKKGAGMLDIAWLSPSTLLSCGYDTFTRLWDTRCGVVQLFAIIVANVIVMMIKLS